MTDHEYHYFDMNAIRFPLSIMNIIIEYEFYYLNCTEPVVYIKAMNLNGCRLKVLEGASRSSTV